MKYDNYEVSACIRLDDKGNRVANDDPAGVAYEQCDDDDPDIAVWTVFGHMPNQGIEELSDHPTEEEALAQVVWCEWLDKHQHTRHEDGSVSIEGDVDIKGRGLEKLPFRFNRISGHFDCSDNLLTTLEGAPEAVGGNFDCSDNQLATLKGSPETVGNRFDCSNNKIVSLAGAPMDVGRYFYCDRNPVEFNGLDIEEAQAARRAQSGGIKL